MDCRLSAARSKQRHEFTSEGFRTKLEKLASLKLKIVEEMGMLQGLCKSLEERNKAIAVAAHL